MNFLRDILSNVKNIKMFMYIPDINQLINDEFINDYRKNKGFIDNLLIYDNSVNTIEEVILYIENKYFDQNIIFQYCQLILDDLDEIRFDNNYKYLYVKDIIEKLLKDGYTLQLKEANIILEELYNRKYEDEYLYYHNNDIFEAIKVLIS